MALLSLGFASDLFGADDTAAPSASSGQAPATRSGQSSSDFSIPELKKLSLEAIMDQTVTTVSREPEKLSEAPGAIQVITSEEIRRSGAVTLPQALRLAPNLQVAQQNAHDWAITARGFNGAPLANNSLADKLLVMIDGRSVYTPLFGGVFWDVQHYLLDDIERIEVVSGPGGALWGANAVNGVINVISKSAKDTQGLLVSGGGGSFVQDFGAVRYGGAAGTNFYYRLYAQRLDHNNTFLSNGADARDSWDMTQGGIRTDYYISPRSTLTVQGDVYSGSEGDQTATRVDGQNILSRWNYVLAEASDVTVQTYLDRTWRHFTDESFAEDLRTYSLDVQHRFPLGERQSILWGGEYRLMHDEINNSPQIAFTPDTRNMQLFSGFVQDEITLVRDELKFTAGTKVEHNDFSGLEIQPSGRLAWMPTRVHTVWAAISRAVRSPARFDADASTPGLAASGDDFDSEKVTAYELGYRVRPIPKLSLSVAGFFNQYDDLRSIDSNAPPTLIFGNHQAANSWGIELSANYQLLDGWRVRGGYTYLNEDIYTTGLGVAPGSDRFEASDPHHQVVLQTMVDLPGNIQLDGAGRYVDLISTSPLPVRPVPAYLTFDLRLAWRYKKVEFSVVGQNLAEDRHREFGANEIPRSVYGKLAWGF